MKQFVYMTALIFLHQSLFAQAYLMQEFLKNETPTERRLNPLKERFEKLVENRWQEEIKKYKTPAGAYYASLGIIIGSLLSLGSFLTPPAVADPEVVLGTGLLCAIPSGFYLWFAKDRDRKESICAGQLHLYKILDQELMGHKEKIECDLNKYGLSRTPQGQEFLDHMNQIIQKYKDELKSCYNEQAQDQQD